MKDYLQFKVTSIRNETPDTRSFALEPLSGELIYKAGQFLTFVMPGFAEERRSYSISSAPLLGEPLMITVKRVDNGAFSRYLFDYVKPGMVLSSIGASGFFTLPDQEKLNNIEKIFFYAAGSGITPIRPLIKTVFHLNSQIRVHLVYSNQHPERTIFLREIESLQKAHPDRFSVDFFFSNARNLLQARLNKALLAQILSREHAGSLRTTLHFLCGPHGYMQMIGIVLLTEGVPTANIRREIFDVIQPLAREVPPDQNKHYVTVHYNGYIRKFAVQYPETILHAALREGMLLPYSCEAGKCGTCAATCTQGTVWMASNEVLLDNELQTGRVLTCTGYPAGGDVELVIP